MLYEPPRLWVSAGARRDDGAPQFIIITGKSDAAGGREQGGQVAEGRADNGQIAGHGLEHRQGQGDGALAGPHRKDVAGGGTVVGGDVADVRAHNDDALLLQAAGQVIVLRRAGAAHQNRLAAGLLQTRQRLHVAVGVDVADVEDDEGVAAADPARDAAPPARQPLPV